MSVAGGADECGGWGGRTIHSKMRWKGMCPVIPRSSDWRKAQASSVMFWRVIFNLPVTNVSDTVSYAALPSLSCCCVNPLLWNR